MNNNKILLYGYGNPGRQDDALGILISDMISEWVRQDNISNITIDSNYQLNIEDAYNLNQYDIVIFVDASKEDISEYKFRKAEPRLNTNFTMHSVSPEFVLGLCKEIYDRTPEGYILHIKGYEWEFMSELSKIAKSNLIKAFTFLKQKIEYYQKSDIGCKSNFSKA